MQWRFTNIVGIVCLPRFIILRVHEIRQVKPSLIIKKVMLLFSKLLCQWQNLIRGIKSKGRSFSTTIGPENICGMFFEKSQNQGNSFWRGKQKC
jgi:hypothetical protein